MPTGWPGRPSKLPPYAEECLKALDSARLGQVISIGGAFGLLHYIDHRRNRGVDAWWSEGATTAQRRQAVELISKVLADHGDLSIHEWGDVCSIELRRKGRTVFNFQIADRSVQLEKSVSAQWTDVQLDSLNDLIASKMVALVERGAPRDFLDIFAVCETQAATPQDCWLLWRERQARSGGSTSRSRATLAITTSLSRIEMRRPLPSIANQQQRSEAERTKNWFREKYINAGLD